MLNRLKSLAITLIGFGFVAMGGFILLTARSRDDVALGAMLVVFFGAVGLVGACELVPARLPERDAGGRIIVRASRIRALIFAFAGIAFMLAGGFMALEMWRNGFSFLLLIGAMGAPLGLAGAVLIGRQALRAQPLYILDAAGIESLNGLRWRLSWRDISGLALGRVGTQRWLTLETHPHVPAPDGWGARLNRRFGSSPYAVAPGVSGVNFEALTDCIVTLWEAQQPNAGNQVPDHE